VFGIYDYENFVSMLSLFELCFNATTTKFVYGFYNNAYCE